MTAIKLFTTQRENINFLIEVSDFPKVTEVHLTEEENMRNKFTLVTEIQFKFPRTFLHKKTIFQYPLPTT